MFNICGECIELCQSILDQRQKRRGPSNNKVLRDPFSSRNRGTSRPVRYRQGNAKTRLAVARTLTIIKATEQ